MRKYIRLMLVGFLVASLSGCMLTRLVDKTFMGMAHEPTYPDRQVTGATLAIFSGAVDIVSFPIQVLLIVILGDNFGAQEIERDPSQNYRMLAAAEKPGQVIELSDEQYAKLQKQLDAWNAEGRPEPTAVAMMDDGEWVALAIDDEMAEEMGMKVAALSPPQQTFSAY